MQTNDISGYTTEAQVRSGEDIIELACALATINRLHEVGEVAFSSDELFDTGQLSIIKQVLASVSGNEETAQSNMISLYNKLQQIKG